MPTQYKYIERLLQEVADATSSDPILSQDYRLSHIRSLVGSVQKYRDASKLLRRLKLYDLVDLADSVDTYGCEKTEWSPKRITVSIWMKWQDQTRARHIYGGCFPERCIRSIGTKGEDKVYRCVQWIGKYYDADYDVKVKFERDWLGERTLDGCTIELQTHTHPTYYNDDDEYEQLSVLCPMRQ